MPTLTLAAAHTNYDKLDPAMTTHDYSRLRSARWYAPNSLRASAHRQRTLAMGFRREEFTNRPVIGIVNTWSELSPCHYHLRERAEAVKRGVWQAGGFPVELPALSLGEVMVKPTTMLYRNLLALDTEELLRQHPIDGVVLMGGTHYGACVLHLSPEAATGGPLALVQTGDVIRLDVAARRIDVLLDDDELARRRAAWTPPEFPVQSGYVELFRNRVLQAHEGCDFVGFGRRGVPEPEIF